MKFVNGMLGAQPEDWNRIAVVAEELGYHGVAVSDHVVYPSYLTSKYPYSPDGTPQFTPEENWPDVWVAIASMAAVTTRLNFMTNVYVLPLRDPFVAAKAIGTAAYLSGNRVGVGVGAGWMREEFELMDRPFERRGARMEEMLQVMAKLWGGGMVEHHGELYDFDPVDMRPAPTEQVPVYIGGASEVAFRRAAQHDGWLGLYHSPDELVQHCRTLNRLREEAGTADRPFEIIAAPLAKPTRELLDDLEAEGVTTILTSAWLPKGVVSPTGDQAVELLTSYAERFLHI